MEEKTKKGKSKAGKPADERLKEYQPIPPHRPTLTVEALPQKDRDIKLLNEIISNCEVRIRKLETIQKSMLNDCGFEKVKDIAKLETLVLKLSDYNRQTDLQLSQIKRKLNRHVHRYIKSLSQENACNEVTSPPQIVTDNFADNILNNIEIKCSTCGGIYHLEILPSGIKLTRITNPNSEVEKGE